MANPDKLELLAAFMKRNKRAREVKAKKEGFASAAEYEVFLREGKSSTRKPRAAKTAKESVNTSKSSDLTDMVIAFDTTGSMASYIGDVKTHVTLLIPELLADNPNLMISVVAFGDYCDMKSATEFGKAYQVLDLTNNENDLIKFVKGAENTSGGDGDEFYELVIKKITEETSWREGSNKSVLFIGDDAPHRVGYSYKGIVEKAQIDWKEEAEKAAAAGIVFDTLKIKPYQIWYEKLSEITGGLSLNFKSANKTAHLVKASALARGGEATKAKFEKEFAGATASGDKEMTAVYGMYKSIVK